MKFRTALKAITYPFSLTHQDHLLLLGSCFTENIGQYLAQYKFSPTINPFGILYNPISILDNLQRVFKEEKIGVDGLFQQGEFWYSHLHHSQIFAENRVVLQQKIDTIDQATFQQLKEGNRLILTFGTAKVYHHKKWGGIVANCHKIDAQSFDSQILTIDAIINRYLPFLQQIKAKNKNLEVIFTLSPVRHIRDGIIENQRSKAILLAAIHEICDQLSFTHYFPSYEIMMDDLRDYRFYENDLIHPSKMAIEYIWNYFQSSFFNESTQQLNQKIHALRQAAHHRAFHPHSAAHQTFLKKQLKKLEQLFKENNHLDLTVERQLLENQLV